MLLQTKLQCVSISVSYIPSSGISTREACEYFKLIQSHQECLGNRAEEARFSMSCASPSSLRNLKLNNGGLSLSHTLCPLRALPPSMPPPHPRTRPRTNHRGECCWTLRQEDCTSGASCTASTHKRPPHTPSTHISSSKASRAVPPHF